MGGDGSVENGHNYVFGFNKNGGRLSPVNLCGDSSKHNVPGGLYVFQIRTDEGMPEVDNSNQIETENAAGNPGSVFRGGGRRSRTDDPLLAKQML